MTSRPARWIALAVAVIAVPLNASGPVAWITATQADFLKGQAIGVSVDELGRVTAGPAIAVVHDPAAPQIWSLAAGPGDTWVAGTGGDGRVIRSRAGQVSTLLDTTETNVYAVATAPDGRVFAATGPDGKVYQIDAAGTSKVIFDPGEKYVWALLVDGSGRLWIGAGTPAVIYRVDAAGSSKPVYKPSASHVVSLALDERGRVLAGTEGPGRVYRFDENDRPTALLDTGLAEVRAMTVAADGTIFAAALAGDGSSNDTAESAVSIGASTSSSSTSSSGASSASAASGAAPSRKSVVFRLTPGATPEPLWETADIVYDLALGDAGAVLAATGPDGHIVSVRPNGSDVLINGVDASQVTRLVKAGAEFLLATANPGRVQSMGPGPAPSGTFLSAAKDAKVPARWGSIRWEASGAVALYTRSGNTDRPDDSWSDWSAPYASSAGSAITSPAGRYLQWKAVFGSGGSGGPAALTSVSIGYLPANSRPVVTSITVHPAGAVFQKPFGEDGAIAGLDDADAQQRRAAQGEGPAPAPALGRRLFQKGLQTFSWRADDADNDRLTYTLSYRREGDAAWQVWRSGIVDPLIVWDTTTVPDGRYSLRVAASDAPSNTADRVLIGERESAAFEVDNTAPVITLDAPRPGAANHLSFTVRDAQSPIDRVEIAMAGGAFKAVTPVDGVADSNEEKYDVTLPAGTDVARVMIRAVDQMQNVSTLRALSSAAGPHGPR